MKKFLILSIFVSVLLGTGSIASACEKAGCSMDKKHCSMQKKQCSTQKKQCASQGAGDHQCPIVARLMKKSDFLLHYSSELALTPEQVQTIKDIRQQAEKDEAQQAEAMKAFMEELETGLKQDKVDVAGLEALIDQTMTGFSSGAKSGVQAYAKLKGVLTEEQVAKVKSIHQNKKTHCGTEKKSCGIKGDCKGKKKGLTPQPKRRS